MLVDAKLNELDDFMKHLYQNIGQYKKTDAKPQSIKTGIYEISHHNFTSYFKGFKMEYEYPELGDLGCYGVCDSIEQWEAHYKSIIDDPNRKFTVCFTKEEKSKQSPDGGWRWHKWGEYIGVQKITCEYLYDEQRIEAVYCFHIFELPESLIESEVE